MAAPVFVPAPAQASTNGRCGAVGLVVAAVPTGLNSGTFSFASAVAACSDRPVTAIYTYGNFAGLAFHGIWNDNGGCSGTVAGTPTPTAFVGTVTADCVVNGVTSHRSGPFALSFAGNVGVVHGSL
jgi:hypothetical protein